MHARHKPCNHWDPAKLQIVYKCHPGRGPAVTSNSFIAEIGLQGFIEGRYVPLSEGESVTASMDIVEADSAEAAAIKAVSPGAA